MFDTLCSGRNGKQVHGRYRSRVFLSLHTSFYNILTDNCLSVLDKYGSIRSKTAAASKRAIRSAVNRSWIDLVKNAELFQRRYFSRPIVDMIALLPKDELPHLAESLVAPNISEATCVP